MAFQGERLLSLHAFVRMSARLSVRLSVQGHLAISTQNPKKLCSTSLLYTDLGRPRGFTRLIVVWNLWSKFQWNLIKILNFSSRKYNWKCRLPNIGHFVQISMCSSSQVKPMLSPLDVTTVTRSSHANVTSTGICRKHMRTTRRRRKGMQSWRYTVKPVYNDHLLRYFSAFWSSSRWPRAT